MRDDLPLFCLPDPRSATVEEFRVALAQIGIRVVVRAPLQAVRRRILGAWDPVLHRIELFLHSQTPESPTRILAHELGHAFSADAQDEAAARAFADKWLNSIPENRIAMWDREFRAEAADIEKRSIAAPARDDCVLPP